MRFPELIIGFWDSFLFFLYDLLKQFTKPFNGFIFQMVILLFYQILFFQCSHNSHIMSPFINFLIKLLINSLQSPYLYRLISPLLIKRLFPRLCTPRILNSHALDLLLLEKINFPHYFF